MRVIDAVDAAYFSSDDSCLRLHATMPFFCRYYLRYDAPLRICHADAQFFGVYAMAALLFSRRRVC